MMRSKYSPGPLCVNVSKIYGAGAASPNVWFTEEDNQYLSAFSSRVLKRK